MKTIAFILTLWVATVAPAMAQPGDDTTRIKAGNMEFLFIGGSGDGDTTAYMIKDGDTTYFDKDGKRSAPSNHEFAHWGGVDLFVGGYVAPNFDFDVRNEATFMDLDYSRSLGFSINPIEKYFPIAGGHFGITTGLGFQFNRYVFKRNTVMQYDADSVWAFTDTLRTFRKNVLKSSYVQVPLFLQFNTNARNANKSLHLAFGVVGGYKMGSRLKLKYEVNDDMNKDKAIGSYNLNPFQLQATARLGFGRFTMFANYSLLTMFEGNRGPELYPITAGITFN